MVKKFRRDDLNNTQTQMKLFNAIVLGAVAGSGFSLASALPSYAGCYPHSAYYDYQEYQSSTSKSNALRISMKENFDGTSDCKVKINSRFMKKEGWRPL